MFAGTLLPNHVVLKFAMTVAAGLLAVLSMKMTDSPGAMLVIPFKDTAAAKEFELSSIFQPVIFTAVEPVFVTSNQSAPTGLLPLDHGATSEMMRVGTGGVSTAWSVTDKVNVVLASGAPPSVGSSTLTVTA